MTVYEKYTHWAALSDYDMESAAILMENERWLHVSALCQQSVERLVKGMIICHTKKESPKSHNIPFLINLLCSNESFKSTPQGVRMENERDTYEDFTIDLMIYLTNDYPFSYKKAMSRFIDKETAEHIYKNTENIRKWLKSFQE